MPWSTASPASSSSRPITWRLRTPMTDLLRTRSGRGHSGQAGAERARRDFGWPRSPRRSRRSCARLVAAVRRLGKDLAVHREHPLDVQFPVEGVAVAARCSPISSAAARDQRSGPRSRATIPPGACGATAGRCAALDHLGAARRRSWRSLAFASPSPPPSVRPKGSSQDGTSRTSGRSVSRHVAALPHEGDVSSRPSSLTISGAIEGRPGCRTGGGAGELDSPAIRSFAVGTRCLSSASASIAVACPFHGVICPTTANTGSGPRPQPARACARPIAIGVEALEVDGAVHDLRPRPRVSRESSSPCSGSSRAPGPQHV